MKNSTQKGFTIIELMIAISVFSVILLICISAIMYVGRLYYLGVSQAKTQEVSRSTLDTISDAVKFSSESVQTLGPEGSWDGAVCVGSRKYSYKLGTMLVDKVEAGKDQSTEVLVESIDPACGSTSATATPANASLSGVENKELLAKYMRVNTFSVVPQSVSLNSSLVTINISVVYGGDGSATVDDSLFVYDGTGNTILSCRVGVGGSQFCAVSNLVKTVYGV